MIRISVWKGDMSDSYLEQVTQLGADCIDFGRDRDFPGVEERGYPDLEGVLGISDTLRTWGLEINRVTLPDLTACYMHDREGAERELDHACRALEVFGKAGVPLARQRFAGDTFPQLTRSYTAEHRGGYTGRGETLQPLETRRRPEPGERERWWSRFRRAYGRLVPIAEEFGIRLAIHPSDTPNQDTPLGALGFHRVIDAFPSPHVGFLYCIGTRAQEGGSRLVLDEINHYGRKGRLLMCHFRNVRGSLATAGAFEEVLLDDGDLNMYRILLELKKVGFDGCLNPDHIPSMAGGRLQGLAYSIGYIKALLAALVV